jgi:hypothetical protein
MGQSAKLNIQINHPLSYPWTNGRLTIDGLGILQSFPIQ